MKVQALLFTVAGTAHCIVDTRSHQSLDGLLLLMQREFPENGAHICTVEVSEVSEATAPTLRPSAPAIRYCTWSACGLVATLSVHADGVTADYCDEHGRDAARVDCLSEVVPLDTAPRSELPTLDEVPRAR